MGFVLYGDVEVVSCSNLALSALGDATFPPTRRACGDRILNVNFWSFFVYLLLQSTIILLQLFGGNPLMLRTLVARFAHHSVYI